MLFFLVALTASAGEAKPPNIVLLYADDWRHDTLGCAGNPVVKTPHLDRFATQGVRFTNSYVTTAICGVSFTVRYVCLLCCACAGKHTFVEEDDGLMGWVVVCADLLIDS